MNSARKFAENLSSKIPKGEYEGLGPLQYAADIMDTHVLPLAKVERLDKHPLQGFHT
jgi:hypothetical protein